MRIGAVGLAVTGVLVLGLGASTAASRPAPDLPEPQILVTQPGSLLKGCGIAVVARSISNLFDEFGNGNFARVNDFFAPTIPRTGHEFAWFGFGRGEVGTLASKRSELIPLLRRLFAEGERFRLRAISARADLFARTIGVTYSIEETAPDKLGGTPLTREVVGKGALDCPLRVFLWSMVRVERPVGPVRNAGPCPQPVGLVDDTAVIACVRK